jgi:hypothetical protein
MRRHLSPLVFIVCTVALVTAIGIARAETGYITPNAEGAERPEGSPGPEGGAAPENIESAFYFGTLLTDANRAAQEAAAGVGVVHLEIGWDLYEPSNNVFNSAYIDQVRDKLQTFRAAGLHVVLGVGLQYPPNWVRSNPDFYYVNQFGVNSGSINDDPNLTFRQSLRNEVEGYVARVNQDLGLDNVWAVRIGSGGYVETLYPDAYDGTHANSYWAYDPAAQTGADLPPSIPVNPFPGWRPGETSHNGQPFTTAQVAEWYDWYLSALADGVNWQIARYRSLGFAGYIHVLMPGQGTRPNDYNTAINNYLNGAGDPSGTMGRGAVWNKIMDKLTDRQNVVAYVSSMADGSGWDDLCQPGDASVPLTDPQIYLWSATRWIAYNANRYGMLKYGENPARGDSGNAYGLAMMRKTAQQMETCGFKGMMWAHDANLYDGASGVGLQHYADIIAYYNTTILLPQPTATPRAVP